MIPTGSLTEVERRVEQRGHPDANDANEVDLGMNGLQPKFRSLLNAMCGSISNRLYCLQIIPDTRLQAVHEVKVATLSA